MLRDEVQENVVAEEGGLQGRCSSSDDGVGVTRAIQEVGGYSSSGFGPVFDVRQQP